MHTLLNQTVERLQSAAPISDTVAGLITGLHGFRNDSGAAEWRRFTETGIRGHEVYPLLMEDPFVRHSALRPRGYPGDAELLDYIYGSNNVRPMIDGASGLGRRLYDFDWQTPAPAAVRNRLRMAASEVDRLAAEGGRPHVLSIACGHLREAQHLESLREGTLGRFVGIDQDLDSLAVVRREWGHAGVETRQADARVLFRHGLKMLGQVDFIYSLGLFDYLSDKSAIRLLNTTFDMLRPGGKVWIANFVKNTWCQAYMEAVMNWWLIYRNEDDLLALADRLDAGKIASRRAFLEPARNVAFLELVRK